MKKRNKPFVTLMLTVLMLAVVISGCSKGNNPGNSAGQNENTGNSGNSQNGAAQEEVKLNDPNITILYHTSKEQYAETKASNPGAYDALWETIPQFEGKFGGKVTVVAVPWGDQKSTLISMVNAGDQVDIAQANDQNFPIYPLKKIVQPIDQYIDLNDELWNDSVTNAFTFGGKAYAVGSTSAPIVMFYNKTMFDDNGVKTPSEYYAEGNWNWDTFREVAKELTQDTDGDGKVDQYGFGWWDAGYALMVASNGKTLLSYNDDGSITTNYDSENLKEAMQFTQDALLKDKFIDSSKDGDYFNAEFKNGKLAMTAEYGFGGYSVFKSDYEIDFVPVPTGPKGEKNVGPGGLGGWSIPTVSKNPQGAAEFIKMMAQNELTTANKINVELYGQAKVDLMNELGSKILFAPIGVEKYFDANFTALTGIKDGTPIGTAATQAKGIMEEGIKITLTQ